MYLIFIQYAANQTVVNQSLRADGWEMVKGRANKNIQVLIKSKNEGVRSVLAQSHKHFGPDFNTTRSQPHINPGILNNNKKLLKFFTNKH